MTTICRLLPHVRGDGPSNMAMDEALLDTVADDPSMAVVRTYEWSTPTLSLGYFQKLEQATADPRWSGVPMVRRPSGGGALWHDREVTYAVVIPATHPSSRPSRSLYRAVHESIAGRLRSFGIPASLRGLSEGDVSSGHRPFLCFKDRDEQDIIFRNAKLVGSAQRRRSGAVLQHGSLMIGRSELTPELPGLADLSPIFAEKANWATFLRDLLSEALSLPVREDDFRSRERRKAELLVSEVYQNPSWTLRR